MFHLRIIYIFPGDPLTLNFRSFITKVLCKINRLECAANVDV